MKKVLMWTGVGVGAAIGTYYAIRGVRGARGRVKDGLGRAERTADAARSVLDTTQKALHTTRENI
jgi:hypothetical protein